MNSMLTNGVTVMLIGMGTVLTFLCIMIFAMIIMSKIVCYLNRLFPELVAAGAVKKPAAASSDDGIAAAIVAAIARK